MKPTTITNKSARQVPFVDYQYQSAGIKSSSSCCIKPSKSLRDISRDYFDGEANDDFMSEAAMFGTLVLTTLVPIVSGASAVLDLFRALPLF